MNSQAAGGFRHTTLLVLLLLLAATPMVLAISLAPFKSWEHHLQTSPDIVFARCTKTPERRGSFDFVIWSDIEVLAVLKGETKPGISRMVSQYWPKQGERFLVFSTYGRVGQEKGYNAIDDYQIVPLGLMYPVELLAGKTLEAQVQEMLRYRLDILDEELKRGAEEKLRLEQGWTQFTTRIHGTKPEAAELEMYVDRVKNIILGMRREDVERMLAAYDVPAHHRGFVPYSRALPTTPGDGTGQSTVYGIAPSWEIILSYDFTSDATSATGTTKGTTSPHNRVNRPAILERLAEVPAPSASAPKGQR